MADTRSQVSGNDPGGNVDGPIVIVRAVCTSIACPSQWDAWDAEGRYYYLRYRHGCGYIQHWPGGPNFWERQDEEPETIAQFEYGDPLDGSMTLAEFVFHAKVEISTDMKETSWGQHFMQMLKTAVAKVGEEENGGIQL
jgi:hypothetical protein